MLVEDGNVWLWKSGDWIHVVTHPPLSGRAILGFDRLSQTVLAVTREGNCGPTVTAYSDQSPSCAGQTWKWSGSAFVQLSAARSAEVGQAPYGGLGFSFTDNASGHAVILGNHILTWTGENWQVGPTSPIAPLASGMLGPSWPAGLGSLDSRSQVIAFGARTCSGDASNSTWTWTSGDAWTPINPAHSPPGRSVTQMSFDPTRNEVVLFGGETDNGCGGLGALEHSGSHFDGWPIGTATYDYH